jgi:hypothetical protein
MFGFHWLKIETSFYVIMTTKKKDIGYTIIVSLCKAFLFNGYMRLNMFEDNYCRWILYKERDNRVIFRGNFC